MYDNEKVEAPPPPASSISSSDYTSVSSSSASTIHPIQPIHTHTIHPTHRTAIHSPSTLPPQQVIRTVSPSHHHGHTHSGHALYEERVEESHPIQSPLTTLMVPSRHHQSDRDIKDEIRALEHERQLLRYERDGEYDVVIERRPRRKSVVRVEKDRKGRLALVRSTN